MENTTHTSPTIAEIDELLSGATPQFSMQLKARLHAMIIKLEENEPARKYGEQQMEMLDKLALGTTRGDDH